MGVAQEGTVDDYILVAMWITICRIQEFVLSQFYSPGDSTSLGGSLSSRSLSSYFIYLKFHVHT